MQDLLSGGYFNKLLKIRHDNLKKQYGIQQIDLCTIGVMKKGKTTNMLEDFVDAGVYSDDDLSGSLKRLYQHDLIEIIKDDDGVHFMGFRLSIKGEELRQRLQDSYMYAEEVVFRGMTEEQVETFRRLAEKAIYNINRETENNMKISRG